MFGRHKRSTQLRDCVGISLTENGVALAVMSRDDNNHPVLRRSSHAECGSIDAVAKQISQWVKEWQLRGMATNFALGAHMYSLILTEAPDVSSAELAAAMRWKVKDLIQFDVADAVVDAFAISGQKERGRTPMAYVVCAAIDVLRAYVQIIAQSQLQLRSIDIPPLVLRNIAHLLPEEQQGVALVSLTERQGVINLCRQGELYLSRDLDVGWQQLMEAGEMGINNLAINSMVLEIQRSMDYYESHFAQPSIRQLVLTPMPQRQPELLEYLRGITGMQVRELDVATLFAADQELPFAQQAGCLPAIGAALRWPIAA